MGVNKKTCIVCIGVFLAFFVLFSGLAVALEAWDGKLLIGGWIRNDSNFRLQGGDIGLHGAGGSGGGTEDGLDQWDWSMCRNMLQLEGTWTPNNNLSVTAIGRGYYEAAMDIDDDIRQNIKDAGAGHRLDDYESDIDLRELYVDYTTDRWHIRAGKQQIVWGETTGFRMADICNPLDFSWQYFFPSWEDIRIPLWGLRVTRRIGIDQSLEFVWLPGKFDNGYQCNNLPPAGSAWAFPGYSQFIIDAIRHTKPDNDESNHEFGLRYKTMVGTLDLGMFWFYSRVDVGIFKKDYLAIFNPGVPGGDELFLWPFTNKLGGSFNYYSHWADCVFRGEAVFTFNEPYNSRNLLTLPIDIYRKNTLGYFFGIDKQWDIPAISERNMVLTQFQLFQKYVFDFDGDKMRTNDQTFDDSQTLMTLYVSCNFMFDRLVPSVYMMYSTSGEWWWRPQVSYDINDYWQIGLGFQIMYAHNYLEPNFGTFQDNDCVYTWVKFAF